MISVNWQTQSKPKLHSHLQNKWQFARVKHQCLGHVEIKPIGVVIMPTTFVVCKAVNFINNINLEMSYICYIIIMHISHLFIFIHTLYRHIFNIFVNTY